MQYPERAVQRQLTSADGAVDRRDDGLCGQGRVACQVRWRAGWGGGPGGRRGMDLRSKECSGVNIVM